MVQIKYLFGAEANERLTYPSDGNENHMHVYHIAPDDTGSLLQINGNLTIHILRHAHAIFRQHKPHPCISFCTRHNTKSMQGMYHNC